MSIVRFCKILTFRWWTLLYTIHEAPWAVLLYETRHANKPCLPLCFICLLTCVPRLMFVCPHVQLIQAGSNYLSKHTGQLSTASVILVFIGALAHIFVSLQVGLSLMTSVGESQTASSRPYLLLVTSCLCVTSPPWRKQSSFPAGNLSRTTFEMLFPSDIPIANEKIVLFGDIE